MQLINATLNVLQIIKIRKLSLKFKCWQWYTIVIKNEENQCEKQDRVIFHNSPCLETKAR
jgi:hypothetical protein